MLPTFVNFITSALLYFVYNLSKTEYLLLYLNKTFYIVKWCAVILIKIHFNRQKLKKVNCIVKTVKVKTFKFKVLYQLFLVFNANYNYIYNTNQWSLSLIEIGAQNEMEKFCSPGSGAFYK